MLARWIRVHHRDTAMLLLADTFPWIPANSPLTAVPVLMKPLNFELPMHKVRSAIPLPPEKKEVA